MIDNLRVLQVEEIKMLDELIEYMNKYNIRYYVLAGTFLGTIRHKGFVPWDDDIDIGVPRNDYDKLVELTERDRKLGSMDIEYIHDDYTMLHYPLRVVNSHVKMKKKTGTKVETTAAWITLFPLDGMPNNRFMRFFHGRILLLRRFNWVMSKYVNIVDYEDHRYSKIKSILVKFVGDIHFYKLFDEKKMTIKMDNSCKKYSFDDSSYIMTLMGGYKLKEVFPKTVFGKGKEYQFENIKVIGPIDYEKYLTQIYGDWRTPPAENDPERNHHNLIEVIIDR